jgi:shikimate kinase
MKTSVALIGFMGVGKSAVSEVLASRLGKRLVRTDSLIESRVGKSIARIFNEEGEIYFREIEIEAIKDIARESNQVIDCGGGVVLNRINIDRLKQNAVLVWLTAAPQVIARRTAADGEERPLLEGKNSISQIKELLIFRRPFYEAAADFQIDTSRLEISAVAEQIIGALKENAGFD